MAANRLVLLGAVPLFLILAIVSYLAVQFAANEREAQASVRHTYQVIAQLDRVLGDAQDAETGHRGYLLTRKPDFLTPYRNGRAHVEADLGILRDLTRDNPSEQARVAILNQMMHERFAAFEATIAATGNGAEASPALLAALELGKTRMDALRREVAGGMAEEHRLLDQRDQTRHDTESLEIAFALGAGLLTLAVLLIAAVILVRNNVVLEDAERARAREAALLQATLDSVREGIACFSPAGVLSACNTGFFTLLDLPPDMARIHATTLAAFQRLESLHPELGKVFAPPAEGQNAGHVSHVTLGRRELDIYKAPVSAGGFLIGVMDVTARLSAEAVARQAQKMEAVGHLTGGIAHDFNNLLQVISANLDLAVAGGVASSDPRLSQRLQNAIGAVARGSRLTGQLLAFARRQPLAPRSLDLGRVIRDVSEMLRRTLGEQVEVETIVAGGLWNTLADPSQLENTVLNLAINARDAMPDGGKLTLEAANAFLDDAYAAAHTEVTAGQYVMLAVSDTGTGIPTEVMARVFEPFFTTKAEGKGTGLGLAQAYGFVKQSGGHIKIYSEPGHGTTIKLYLPRTRRVQDTIDVAPGLPVERGSEAILVVEDDADVRAAVTDMLRDMGYRVLTADNAEAGLKLLEGAEPVDLLFTDVVMPGNIPTRDFTRRAQEMRPAIRVLYTSGYTQNSIVHNGKLDDDAVLLSKPYRRDELARKLRSVLAGTARGAIAPEPATPPAHHGKVLVVEDVALIRMTTVDMVEQLGFPCAEAGDATEALAILDQDAEIAILLTDLGLPGMDGRQLMVEALKRRPGLKVIVASGYSTQQDEGIIPGAFHLTKPFDLAQLRKALGV